MRKSNTEHIGDIIEEYIDALKLRGKMKHFRATKLWPEVMGPAIAKATKKIYAKEGKMFVHIDSPVLKHELYMAKSGIINTLNKKLGGKVIIDIIFR